MKFNAGSSHTFKLRVLPAKLLKLDLPQRFSRGHFVTCLSLENIRPNGTFLNLLWRCHNHSTCKTEQKKKRKRPHFHRPQHVQLNVCKDKKTRVYVKFSMTCYWNSHCKGQSIENQQGRAHIKIFKYKEGDILPSNIKSNMSAPLKSCKKENHHSFYYFTEKENCLSAFR